MTGTVAEIIGDAPQRETLLEPFEPPRLGGQPPFPEPGVYFNMPDEEYHAIHACSASGLKHMSVSSMNYWANSVLNEERAEPTTRDDGKLTPLQLGQAYHAYIVEGKAAFEQRYCVALDKEEEREKSKKAGIPFCVTIADIRQAIDDAGGKPKGTNKDALIEQLLDLAPAFVWDREVAGHAKANEGKLMISQTLYRRILIADAMIKNDPQLKDAFSGGYPEVSIFWYDEKTGIPCKARLDYIKMNYLIDLKSFGNKQNKPIQRAIDMAISYEKYYLAVAFYLEAIVAGKKMVRDTKGKCVFEYRPHIEVGGDGIKRVVRSQHDASPDLIEWCWKWAHQPKPECIWIFQQTGIAPVTRGRKMIDGSTLEINRMAMLMLMRKWRKCALAYGTDPWLDIEPVRATVDEELTFAATDYGDIDYE